MHRKPPVAAPSAPPLSPAWAEHDVHVYAVPVAQRVASPLPPPPPPPPPPLAPLVDTSAQARRRVAVDVRTEDRFCPSVWSALWFASHVLAYHVANACVGLAGALLVAFGLALALALLPLCGFGLVVFSVAVHTAHQLSWFDAKMHNTIPLDDHETIAFPEEDAERRPLLPVHDPRRAATTLGHPTPRPRFAEELQSPFSSHGLTLLLYVGVVKFVLGVLSVLNLLVLVVLACSLVSDDFRLSLTIDAPTKATVDTSEWSTLDNVVGAFVSTVCLHVLTRVSLAATRFFCCERS